MPRKLMQPSISHAHRSKALPRRPPWAAYSGAGRARFASRAARDVAVAAVVIAPVVAPIIIAPVIAAVVVGAAVHDEYRTLNSLGVDKQCNPIAGVHTLHKS